jgi:hypothetical protein
VQVGKTLKESIDILKVTSFAAATTLQFYELVDNDFLEIKLTKSPKFPNSSAPKLNAIEVKLDVPHVFHAVAHGPYFGTVIDYSGVGKVSLVGETSHTHGPGLVISEVAWKEGNKIKANTLNFDYAFPFGNHTVSSTV